MEFQKVNTIERIKHEQEVLGPRLEEKLHSPFTPKPIDHPSFNFEKTEVQICRSVLLFPWIQGKSSIPC